ncbi:MAG: spore gernimation protein [Firmicutes bacterium HGW-Firmicutes-16]|nr:MAG: spore gernimation protein [Firmicutes bacterium HGW-Firmicutes-16]
MQKEMISARQMFCIIIMFIFGSSVIMGVSSGAAQDSWMSLLLAAVFTVPMLLIYARIIKLFPEKNLFEIIEMLFGKIAGNIIIILMVWYSLHLCALVLRNFSEYIQIVSMPETPQLPIMIAMILVVVYMAKSGIETMGKWSIAMLSAVFLVVIITILFSLNKMDFTNILPFMENDFKSIAAGAFRLYAFPFAETVLFLCLADAMKKKDSPRKLYLYALLFSTVVLLLVILRNLFMMGPGMVGASYFASYVAVKLIDVADFFARIEGFISMNFILAGIIKITVCLMAAAKGTARLFGINNYRKLLLPVSLLAVALSAIVYKNVMEMIDFLRFYTYYAVPFQVIIPLTVWIAAEIRMHKRKLA